MALFPRLRSRVGEYELDACEVVSIDGTHLGHNLADEDGNRYCIDLVCIAGRPTSPPPPPIEVYLGNGCFW